MTSELKAIEELVVNNGTDRAITIIFLAIVLIFFGVFFRRYLKSLDKQEEIQNRNNSNYINLIKQITEAITNNTNDVGDFKAGLSDHDKHSVDNFQKLNLRLDDLEEKVDIIEANTENSATKAMLSELKEELKDIRVKLKKD